MKLYNTKTLEIEEFKPRKEGEVSLYVCGPTVYNYAHIGNARPMVVFDVLKRVFEAIGLRKQLPIVIFKRMKICENN